MKEFSRTQKIQKVKHSYDMKEKQFEEERELYNMERWKKLELDQENEKASAAQTKKKLDQELQMKELHSQKKNEIYHREVELCLEKLKEIEDRVDRGV